MVWLTWLAASAGLTGYPVHEVDGWKTRGTKGQQMSELLGVVGHHTGTPAFRTGDMPTLNILRDGHSTLPGPLAHLGLGRSGAIYVVAAGRCNHAGVSAFAGRADLNDKTVGIEMENPGDGKWTPAQLDCLPKLVAALLKTMGQPASRYASHRTVALPAGRKDDPRGIEDAWVQAKVLDIWNTIPPATEPDAAAPACSDDLPILRRGDRNEHVMALHMFMTRVFPSYATFKPTGFYGDLTVVAVREFQANSGVTGADADGTIVGRRTNEALWRYGYRGVA